MLLRPKALFSVLAVFLVFSKGNAMELNEALRITKAWADDVGRAVVLDSTTIESNGAFVAEAGGAFFRYQPKRKELLVGGLVDDKVTMFAKYPDEWERLVRAAEREKPTLGEGHLERVTHPLLRWQPELILLTKSFSADHIDVRRFFVEVRWLLEWSTYWRTRRYGEVVESLDENALIREAPEINAWMQKHRPPPKVIADGGSAKDTRMTSDQALHCVEAWAKAKGRTAALKTIAVASNGDFNVEVGAAGFRFTQRDGVLLASGYVASGQVDLVNPVAGGETWAWLNSLASLQPATLGEGHLELYTGTADPQSKKPVVYLTKKFSSPPASSDQFVREVAWLVRWATYWRDERWDEIFSSRTDDQLKVDAAGAQAWALKKHPRPW